MIYAVLSTTTSRIHSYYLECKKINTLHTVQWILAVSSQQTCSQRHKNESPGTGSRYQSLQRL